MQREKLFFWPLCMSSYTPEEGGGGPFPTYENGDIFLAWARTGRPPYVQHRPEVAVRIVKNVHRQVCHDGLAFQRYLRKSQTGEGNDILSNMASPSSGSIATSTASSRSGTALPRSASDAGTRRHATKVLAPRPDVSYRLEINDYGISSTISPSETSEHLRSM